MAGGGGVWGEGVGVGAGAGVALAGVLSLGAPSPGRQISPSSSTTSFLTVVRGRRTVFLGGLGMVVRS
ncbi:MAG: hypothetical protein RI897_3259 [Verrucomicrobiota bacterium]|jgi:hypothetical protein